jgi:hypothetical protein
VSAWNLSLLGLAGAIWLTIFFAMAYAVRATELMRARGLEPPRASRPNGT